MLKRKNIAIIGCGISGLTAACLLANQGHYVSIYEKNNQPGGCCSFTKRSNTLLNWGADYLTDPNPLRDVFESINIDFNSMINLIPIEPNIRYISNNDSFDYETNESLLIKKIEAINPEDRDNFIKLKRKYQDIFTTFSDLQDINHSNIEKRINIPAKLFIEKKYPNIYKLTNGIIKNNFLMKAFSYHPLFIGSDPKSTNYFHQFNPFLSKGQQLYYPIGGINSVVQNLVKISIDLGVKIFYNSSVSEIMAKNHKVIGIRLIDGNLIPVDTVISSADIVYTVNNLLPTQYRDKIINKPYKASDHSSSLFIFTIITSKKYDNQELTQHNIIIDGDLSNFSEDLFRKHKLSTDNIFTLNIPTLNDHSLAPENYDIIKVSLPVPNLSANLDWSKNTWLLRNQIINYLESRYFDSLSSNIVYEDHISPVKFSHSYNYQFGSPFSLQPNNEQIFTKRPASPINILHGFYLIGNGTHPGPGINFVITSAKIICNMINAT